jgi:uncharacterized protein (TIGR03382 family)
MGGRGASELHGFRAMVSSRHLWVAAQSTPLHQLSLQSLLMPEWLVTSSPDGCGTSSGPGLALPLLLLLLLLCRPS